MLRSQVTTEENRPLRTTEAFRAAWPDAVTYREAVQTPSLTFSDASLRASALSLDRRGLPVAYAGRFAVVFRATLPDGESWAAALLHHPRRRRKRRHRSGRTVTGPSRRYVNEERSRFRPLSLPRTGRQNRRDVVSRRWRCAGRPGVPLGRWVEANRRDPAALRNLADVPDGAS